MPPNPRPATRSSAPARTQSAGPLTGRPLPSLLRIPLHKSAVEPIDQIDEQIESLALDLVSLGIAVDCRERYSARPGLDNRGAAHADRDNSARRYKRPLVLKTPKGRPGELGADRDKTVIRGICLRGKMLGIALLLSEVEKEAAYCAAAVELPSEERDEFFVASSTNSVSVADTRAIA